SPPPVDTWMRSSPCGNGRMNTSMRPSSTDSYASHRPSGAKLALLPQVRPESNGCLGPEPSTGILKFEPVGPDPSENASVDPSGESASGICTSSLVESRCSSPAPSARRDQRFQPRDSRADP